MSLSLSLSCQQRLKEEQTIKLSQSLALKESMNWIRWNIYPLEDDVAVIGDLIKSFLLKIVDPNLKLMIEQVFDDKKIKEMMYNQSALLSIPKKTNIDHFVYRYLFQNILTIQEEIKKWGEFFDEEQMLRKRDEWNVIKAFTQREDLEKQLEMIRETIKDTSSPWLLEDFNSINNILNTIDEEMVKQAGNISLLVQFLLTQKITKEENDNKNNEPNILGFLREKVILEQISDFSSERLLRRFLKQLPSFLPRKEASNCRELRNRTMETIGEFMLISLGIISPSMFKLYKFSISEEQIDDLTKNTDTTREEIANLFTYYNLRGIDGKPIFYNRRFTQNQLPSKEADGLVKDFLANIRTHSEKIATSFWYEAFENKVIEAKRDRDLDKEETDEIIIEELNNRLGNKEFIKNIISQILANYKYKNTYQLIKPKKVIT